MSEAKVVRFEVEDGIGVITVDYPPVNALGPGVSDGICEAVAKGEADPAVQAMVLMGAGRTFIAGADIRRFGTPRPPSPKRSYEALDESTKPIVAAIHGYALGGGLENAMSCNYRIAVPSAKVGLPEVLIGILPGGGGTQRLPRLIGPKAAMEMIVSGRHVPAEEAKALGIIDAIIPGKDLRGRGDRLCEDRRRQAAAPRQRDDGAPGRGDAGDVRGDAQVHRPQARATRRRPTTASRRWRRRRSCPSRRASPRSGACSTSWRTPTRPRRCATPSSPSARWRSCRTCRRTWRCRRSGPWPWSAPAPWAAASPWASPMPASP